MKLTKLAVALAAALAYNTAPAAININSAKLTGSTAVNVYSCSSSFAVVSTSITTSAGNKVKIDASIQVGVSGSQSFTFWGFQLYRDTTLLYDSQNGGSTSLLASQSAVSWTYIDAPSAATHAYKIAVCTNYGGQTTVWPGTSITVWEMKTD